MSGGSARAGRTPRWALSFADLCLLLLGFFVILHARAGDPHRVADSMRSAFGDAVPQAARTDYPATALFQPGEAVLTPSGAKWLAALGAQAVRARSGVLIVSDGMDGATPRLDGWELAAARAAAAARAVRSAGLDERRVTISIPAIAGGGRRGQTLRITLAA